MEFPALVSIGLPTFNGSRYLVEAIESCLEQTYSNWELLIVDDCSTDGTPQIIKKFVASDSRIRSIRHSSNRKLPVSLNSSLTAAKGDFITWTSDDNRYRPEALAEMVHFLTENLEVDLVYTDMTVFQDDLRGRHQHLQRAGPVSDLAIRNCIGASFMFRRELFQILGGYDETLFLTED
jgi:glycosyltransferase involved in cell wall biosynthesis